MYHGNDESIADFFCAHRVPVCARRAEKPEDLCPGSSLKNSVLSQPVSILLPPMYYHHTAKALVNEAGCVIQFNSILLRASCVVHTFTNRYAGPKPLGQSSNISTLAGCRSQRRSQRLTHGLVVLPVVLLEGAGAVASPALALRALCGVPSLP